jgi:hypothetical protein
MGKTKALPLPWTLPVIHDRRSEDIAAVTRESRKPIEVVETRDVDHVDALVLEHLCDTGNRGAPELPPITELLRGLLGIFRG